MIKYLLQRGFLTTVLLASGESCAQTNEGSTSALPVDLGLSGSLRIGYWSSSRNLDERSHLAATSVWLQATPTLSDNVSLWAEGWIRNEDLFDGTATDAALREGYIDLHTGALDWRLGKQIIAWGRADRLNPTDNLSPRDFTLLVPEDDDQRHGTVAATATYYLADFALSALWLPRFEPHTVPFQQVPGVNFEEQVPHGRGQWAGKLERIGTGVDWSLSYFDGYDLNPDIALKDGSSSGLTIALNHHRIRVLGADIATTLGRFGLRAEMAYTFTADETGADPQIKNPFFYSVIGIERTVFESLNINVQYVTRIVSNYRDPEALEDPLQRLLAVQESALTNQRDAKQHGVSVRISDKWFNDTLEAEMSGIFAFPRSDYVVRSKVAYAFTDRWNGTCGMDIFRGPEDSFYGRLRNNSMVYAELKFSF